jgi:hypothetical protein
MWDLQTIIKINQIASDQAIKKMPEKDALLIATGVRKPERNQINRIILTDTIQGK